MAYINATIYKSHFRQIFFFGGKNGEYGMESKIKRLLTLIIVLLMLVCQFGINNGILNPNTVRAKTVVDVNNDFYRNEQRNNGFNNNNPFGINLMGLNAGETVKEIAKPYPNTYEVMVGTAFEEIGLQSTLLVVYTLENGTEETRAETISWTSADPLNIYNSDKDGEYVLKATFDDATIADLEIDTVTVKVKGQALADDIKALPEMSEAVNYTNAERLELRSKLINITNEFNLLTDGEQNLLEAYIGPQEMGKYQALYDEFVLKDGSVAEFLDGDWAYVSRFEIVDIQDGTGPFDTSEDPNDPSYKDRPGNDCCPDNRIVRTFDTVSYDFSYSTAISGEYLGVKEGYLYYEFVLPYRADQAEWDVDGMTWIGLKVNNIAELADKKDGESYYVIENKLVDGVMSQVLTGKRFVVPVEPNPSAFPGSATLNAVVRVLNIENGSTIEPKFTIWLEHNHLDGVCPKHNRVEAKTVYGDPVTVSSELRLNVQLKEIHNMYANGLDTFNFSTGNELAMNKDAGGVYGRLVGYGITLQLYNIDPNDGLKGVAIPEGPITFDLNFKVTFRREDGAVFDLSGQSLYVPLVWSYEGNSSSTIQLDGRDIVKYVQLRYGVNASPGSSTLNPTSKNRPMGEYSPTTGTVTVWNGGTWTGSQTGSTVSFTVDNYVINPNYFPNGDFGNSLISKVYFNAENGVRSTHIGGFSGAELFVVVPFGENETYLPTVYGGNGTVEFVITDVNLRASSPTAGSLPIVTDNSNQTKPNKEGLPLEDDTLVRTVYLAMPGTYDNRIQYIRSVNHYDGTDIAGTLEWIYTGKDTATRDQQFAILWGGVYNPNGEQRNAIYALNSLMKFDPVGLELTGEPQIHTKQGYLDSTFTATFLYACKPNGQVWVSDFEMDDAIEADLVYFKTLEEAQAYGVVVGILAEARNDNPRVARTQVFFSVPVKVKANAPTDVVYQIVQRSNVWLGKAYNDAGKYIPRRYDNLDGVVYPKATIYNYPVTNNNKIYYSKAIYKDGANIGGHVGSSNRGDSVYVTPYTAAIKKEVVQKAGGQEKKNFDLDAYQRVVDFRLTPSVKTLVPSQQQILTNVTIVDVLPKGLTYIDGSAYFGGTYTQNPASGRQGTVTGGVQIEPSTIVVNTTTGETTLTWFIENVVVNSDMPKIIYSANIGEPGTPNDVANNEHLLNKVWISATEDNREKTKVNGNYDEVGIKVSKLSATSLAKIPYSKYVDLSEDIGWKAYVSNNAINPYTDAIILDTFPFNGDICGSKFDPTTQTILQEWSIDTSLSTVENLSEWEVYYTTDLTVRGTISQDYNPADIRAGKSILENLDEVNWIKATLDPVTGAITGVTGAVTAVVTMGDLDGGKTLVQNVVLSTEPKLKGGDIFANTLSRALNEVCSPVYVIQRTLEGLMWHDANADGIRQISEDVFIEGTVSLLIQNAAGEYVPYLDETGNPVSVALGKQLDLDTGEITDLSAGRYKFVGLPAGMFGVRFVTNYIEDYRASAMNIGNDYTDSDAAGEYVSGFLKSTVITGIKMPEKHEMASAIYASRFNDSGIHKRTVEIQVEKFWDDNKNQDGVRADSVTVELYADDIATGEKITLDGTNSWKDKFSNLVEYDKGKLIIYTIKEEAVGNNYESTIKANEAGTGYDVTNSRTPGTTSVTVNKVWDDNSNQDGLRTDVTLKLIPTVDGSVVLWTDLVNASASGTLMDADGLVTLTNKTDESHIFTNLPVKYNGKTIVYMVEEVEVPKGYTVEYDQNTLTVKNRHTPETIDVAGEKIWIDDDVTERRPESITIRLMNGNVEVDFVVVTETDGWSWSFEGVDKYENGELIEYTITEDEVKNYASEVEGYNVTNTYIPPVVPKTGDNFKPIVVTMVVLMSVSLAAIVGLSVYQYKSKKKNKK